MDVHSAGKVCGSALWSSSQVGKAPMRDVDLGISVARRVPTAEHLWRSFSGSPSPVSSASLSVGTSRASA